MGWAMGTLLLVAIAAVAAVYFLSNARLERAFQVSPRTVEIRSDAATIARGKHLAETRGCNDCHGRDYAGSVIVADGAMGVLHGTNLTRGRGSRVASFDDADWIRAIRHGVGRDGRGLFIMPSEEYARFSDDDLGALVAYLKTLPAVDRERVPTRLGPVSRVLLATGKMKLAAEVIDHTEVQPSRVTPAVGVDYGRYVAASCTGCHGSTFAGGKIAVGPPSWPEAANLTPHTDSRLTRWTEEDFLRAMKTARRPDGSEINPVMPRAFGGMNDVELKALWAFFRSLPAKPTGSR